MVILKLNKLSMDISFILYIMLWYLIQMIDFILTVFVFELSMDKLSMDKLNWVWIFHSYSILCCDT